jgi:hypothetical protein
MKQTLQFLFLLIFIIIFTNEIHAQYPIPSYNVPIVADPTLFEEEIAQPLNINSNHWILLPIICGPVGIGEKAVVVKIRDDITTSTAQADINIYSLDGSIIYGPFTVIEGTNLVVPLDAGYLWGVRVLTTTPISEMDVWFD